MLIPDPAMVQGKKSMIFLMILEILKDSTDIGHPMLKEELRSKIKDKFGFLPSRNNIYDKLNALVEAGFPIVQDSVGVYYDGAVLSDGELRFLADSVLFSDFATHRAAADIIEALSALGSHEFKKYMKKQVYRTKKTRKNPRMDVFLNLERVQQAIFDQHQISCNFLTYTAEMQTELVYPENIVINPYDIVYKNGKYYLFGALPDSEKMLSWRLDRLCSFKDLETRRTDIPLLKEIEACGGMSAYVDAQPDLCGGVVETFKLQCFRDAVDEVVDAFGSDFRIAPEQSENFDSETVIVIVRTTREAMKAWAFTHAGTIVVISPDDFRKEIVESLSEAKRLYHVTGKPLHVRVFTAKDFSEAIRFSKKRSEKTVLYHGKGKNLGKGKHEKEQIDLSLLSEMPDVISLSLNDCKIDHPDYMSQLPHLRRLHLVNCVFPVDTVTALDKIEELQTDDLSLALQLAKKSPLKSLTLLGSNLKDISFVTEIASLRRLSLVHCDSLTDCSALVHAEQIERLEISHCDTLKDVSFLEQMRHLKELRIDCLQLDNDAMNKTKDALVTKGVKVYSRYLRDSHDENDVMKSGTDPFVQD